MLVVGGKEEESETVSLRDRIEGDLGSLPIGEAIEKLKKEVENREIRQTFEADFAGLEADQDVANEY
jgi:threonyl-tRNA synthetase